MIPSQFIAAGVVLVVALILMVGVSSGNPLVPLLVAMFPVGVFLISRPDVWLAVLVAIAWSGLTFPGAPVNLNAFHILSAAFIVFLVFYQMMHGGRRRQSPMRKCVLAFLVVLLVVGFRSGMGLRMLGSDHWGGSAYVVLTIGCLMLLMSDIITLTSRQWQKALIALCLLNFLPVLAQSMFVFSGGRVMLQYAFIQPKGFILSTLNAMSSGTDIARFSTDYGVTLLYLPLLLFAEPMRGRHALVTMGFLAVALVVASLSGSRYSVIMVISFTFFWSLIGTARIHWWRTLGVLFALVLLLAAVAPLASHFPTPIQRALSFVPWADITPEVRLNAAGTAIWRLDVWERAIREDLPRYWLSGRGFAFDPREYEALRALGLEVRDWAFITGSYHSGPLSLLINLGIAGFLAAVLFFISTFRTHLRQLYTDFHDPYLPRMCRLVLAMFANHTFLFLTLGGDVQNYFPVFLLQATILQGLARTKEATDAAALEPGALAPERPSIPQPIAQPPL